ncbi:type II secretion system protein [Thalassolituus sp.]|jgi:MSHA biogenesis protein MshO|uniref:type II secretion system protein n=1 Tax=Thalassolituus sp. TaxID=2030822 RepID=UPI002A83E486|nr:type II secretion system protein [Thalassolituus sp.]|tara:strand:+ start:1390 stop:2196 length:807 start_codon:yes stop_codon:yes gene_type:complete
MYLPAKYRAFTLIELIMVIAIASVMATVSVRFITLASQGLIDTGARQQLSGSSSVVNEQISRALRDALPGSIRTTADGLCVEYMPIVAASSYTDVELGNSISLLRAAPYSQVRAANGYVSIYPLASNNLYSLANPGALTANLATVNAGNSEITVTLGGPHRFPTDSPNRRFYLSTEPETICQDGSYLYRYSGYGFISNVASLRSSLPADTASGREVLAYPLVNNSMVFRYSPATLQRNGIVSFNYQLQHDATGELLSAAQQVRIRNVP